MESLTLTEAVPNPTRGRATLYLVARTGGHVTAALYDARGRRVAVLQDGPMAPNSPLALDVDAVDLPSGLYFVRARGSGVHATRALTVGR